MDKTRVFISRCTHKTWFVHATEYEVLALATTWVTLEDIKLSKTPDTKQQLYLHERSSLDKFIETKKGKGCGSLRGT